MAHGALLAITAVTLCGFISFLPNLVDASGICAERHFQCGDGRCIPLTWVCEGEADCADGTDETAPECKGARNLPAVPIVTTTETSTTASEDALPIPEPPIESPRNNPNSDDYSRLAQRLPVGGILESTDALRMIGLVRKLPLQFVNEVGAYKTDYSRYCEPGTRCDRALKSDQSTTIAPAGKSDDELLVSEPLDLNDDENIEIRRRKQKPKGRPTTPPPVRGSSSCCKQSSGGSGSTDEEMAMRRELARVNLDVLRRLASMLNEEREKFQAERQMLSASREMMMAETKRVNSERGKIDSERQKVDLERDLLQSQMLGRRSPRLAYLDGN